MRYFYYDIGEQPKGTRLVAHLRGSAANVIVLDPLNFDRYRSGQPFVYTGGLYTRTPARLQLPEDGHWYLVVDCGGYTHRVGVLKVEMFPPDESLIASDLETTLVEAHA
jgi:hypothetical protein